MDGDHELHWEIMGVIKRGNSKYWYVQFQLNGRTYIKSSQSTEKRVAESIEAEWRRQLVHQSLTGVKERIKVGLATEMFGASKRDMASHPHLVRHLSTLVELLAHRTYFDEMTSADLEKIRLNRQQLGYANQTIKHLLGAFSGTVKYIGRMGYQIPVVEYPKIQISRGKLRYLSFEEERQLLRANDPVRDIKGMAPYGQRPHGTQREMDDLYDFLVLLIDTGARYGELSGLTWRNVDFQQKSIGLWRPKVRNESVLFMTDRVHDIFQKRLKIKSSDFVFQNREGKARGYIASTLRRAFDRARLFDCSAHTLRHTHATRLIQNGLNLYEVKEMLGHADIKTTMRYAHIEQRSTSIKAREVMDRINKVQMSLVANPLDVITNLNPIPPALSF